MWKFMRYRMSLIWRGEVEIVTVERFLFSVLRATFIIGTIIIFYSAVGQPLTAAWQRVVQALTKAGI